MSSSLAKTAESMRFDSLDSVRPQPAKASLPVNPDQSAMPSLIAEAIRRTGSQKEAAIDMGIDPGQAHRQLANGHLTAERIDRLKPAAKAELGRLLVEAYGPLATPASRARELARRQREMASELEQLAEYIA